METKHQPAKETRRTEVMDRLEKLPMGTGLFPDERDQSHEKEYAEVFHEVIEEVEHLLGRSRLRAILEHLPTSHELTEYIQVSGSDVTLAKNGRRALALGTVRLSAANSQLAEFPLDVTNSLPTVKALAERYATLAATTRKAIETATGQGDANTADLFTEASRGLDKALWFLEAHLQE